MENASKVLIIAGSLCVVLILVSLSVIIINKIEPQVNNAGAQIDTVALINHNNKFSKYNGTGITGAQVKECIALAISNNRNAESDDFTVEVSCGAVFVPASRNTAGVANASTILNTAIYTGTVISRANGTIASITFH